MADSDVNCSSNLPRSEVYFSGISVVEKTGVILALAGCVAVIGLFLDNVRFILKKYHTGRDKPALKLKSLWLLGLYPVFSSMALLAVFVPRAALLCDLASSVYLAVCLFHFTSLIIVYGGGVTSLLDKVDDDLGGFQLQTLPCCCCCLCCPLLMPTRSNLWRVRVMVLQNTFVQPFVSFITVVLWMDEKFVRGQIAADKPRIYLSAINILSTGMAIYGLMILFWSCQGFLKSHSVRPKFFVMQVVMLLHNVQGLAFFIMSRSNVPPCTGQLSSAVRAEGVRHMLMVGEMFVLALLARFLYRKPHYAEQEVQVEPPYGADLPAKTNSEHEAATRVSSDTRLDLCLDVVDCQSAVQGWMSLTS